MNAAKLPSWLEQSLENMTTALSPLQLKEAYHALSKRYQQSPRQSGVKSKEEAQAYTYARLPATYAVAYEVLQKLPDSFHPRSVVDFGSGPGTAAWAALELFDGLETIECVENDPWMLSMLAYFQEIKQAPLTIHRRDFTSASGDIKGDLAIFCYSLNELKSSQQQHLMENLENFTYVVLIFPGTPSHFADLKELRSQLISMGWTIQAPCPHQLACPMEKDDWCHFSKRLPRLSSHRLIKDADLNFEDEKYSYLIVSKDSLVPHQQGRIIKRPLKRSGHVLLDICKKNGHLERVTVSKKDGLYKQIKKSDWGDLFP